EAAVDDEHGGLALALQQGVGADGRAHLHGGNALDGNWPVRRRAEQVADALQRGVAIALGVLREQLVGDELAFGRAGDDVGEGAAAVDPELPAPVAHLLLRSVSRMLTKYR